MCDAAGLDFTSLIDLLIDQAVEKYKSKQKLQTSR
jgi:hypothetical protein